ncbi:CerR family C-terminal domain-containing protein [Methylomonas sp. EFPC3]|uniref:CerR family C-terminal domain-containing protein n=1 Tax=Methylomonas sp. EFPC3 TaxID=3021710 RepID=UPI002417E479|nr:CerR family C-terminal domain-containing protein [Methylomonas sp. EFPC3]WFP49442.1 CerR family C-terminal domain-containing protein [Methylomonas sp. EFPC3]
MTKTTPYDTDTHDSRSRLVSAALRLFAEKGYEGASTREICEAAGVNISAIRYYFGDKAGLYRAAFTEPMGESPCGANIAEYADLPLPEVFYRFFSEFLEPLKKGEELGLVMKLHFREMIEPTGAWQQEIDAEIKPQHDGLVALLQAHFGLAEIDDDLHRLAFSITGMAVHFYVGQDVIAAVSPPLLNTPDAVDILAERLAGYATAMVAGEAARRRLPVVAQVWHSH